MLLSLKLNLIVDIRQGHGKSVHLYFSGLQVIFVAAMFFVISSIEQFDGKFMRTFLLVNLVTDGKVCQEYRCEVLAVCSCLIVLYLLVWMCQSCFFIYRRIPVAPLQGKFCIHAQDILFVAPHHPLFTTQEVKDKVAVEFGVVPHSVASTITGVEKRAGKHIIVTSVKVSLQRNVHSDILPSPPG